jgi:hypothetical protein
MPIMFRSLSHLSSPRIKQSFLHESLQRGFYGRGLQTRCAKATPGDIGLWRWFRKPFGGLPWWDRKIVLLTFFERGGNGFERGETYFVEGNREVSSPDAAPTHL